MLPSGKYIHTHAVILTDSSVRVALSSIVLSDSQADLWRVYVKESSSNVLAGGLPDSGRDLLRFGLGV